MAERCDVAIIGGGMAGASLAAELAPHLRVAVLEAEAQPGYHATGRSAAFWDETYGGTGVQPLTTASGSDLRALGMLTERGALTLGRPGDEARVEGFVRSFAARGVRLTIVGREEMARRVPGLRSGWSIGAWAPDCSDIDVAALHQHYLSRARRAGAEIRCNARLVGARRQAPGWLLALEDGTEVACEILANAAGAWADPIAQLAGVDPLGIAPLRRTVAQLRVSPAAPSDLPLVLDIAQGFYFKPESGRLWLSPHDETPSPACDAAPDEIDVAIAIDRFAGVVDWQVERVERKWAGLRSFAPDRLPVYGFDPGTSGFFWFAGQGGFGIQTAPAAARLAAGLVLGRPAGEVDPGPYSPRRFR